jgi:hypothetical protein
MRIVALVAGPPSPLDPCTPNVPAKVVIMLPATHAVAPAAASKPDAHAVQLVAPAAALYVPALHAVQGLLPVLLAEPGGHGNEYVMLLTSKLLASATYSTPVAPERAMPRGWLKRAAVPMPSTRPALAPPARVLTFPSGVTARTLLLKTSAT